MKSGLTVSLVFEAASANYNESVGNISILKRMTRGDQKQYSYISRQAMRYSIIQQLGWDISPTMASGGKGAGVVQFCPDATVEDFPEVDLFGYMKTEEGKGAVTRSAVARLSNAVAMEPFASDMEFLTNMGLAKRTGDANAIAQIEQHMSLYAYTLTIDLERVGIDGNIGTALDTGERAQRVCDLLSCVEFLYRDVKGRRENLAPVFAIGGVYDIKCPFFENRLRLKNGRCLDVDMVGSVMAGLPDDTRVGYLTGAFSNDGEVEDVLNPVSVGAFFDALRNDVKTAYAEADGL